MLPPDYPRPEPDYFWITRWSQRRNVTDYIDLTRQALEGIDFSIHRNFCIFNCSDEPSSLGLVSQILTISPQPLILLSDISDYATLACQEYIGNRMDVDLLTVVSDIENLVLQAGQQLGKVLIHHSGIETFKGPLITGILSK